MHNNNTGKIYLWLFQTCEKFLSISRKICVLFFFLNFSCFFRFTLFLIILCWLSEILNRILWIFQNDQKKGKKKRYNAVLFHADFRKLLVLCELFHWWSKEEKRCAILFLNQFYSPTQFLGEICTRQTQKIAKTYPKKLIFDGWP